MEERLDILDSSHGAGGAAASTSSTGFQNALVQSLTQVCEGGDSYRVVLNIHGTGITYRAGDCIQILPKNDSLLVDAMLDALGVGGSTAAAAATMVDVKATGGSEWCRSSRPNELPAGLLPTSELL